MCVCVALGMCVAACHSQGGWGGDSGGEGGGGGGGARGGGLVLNPFNDFATHRRACYQGQPRVLFATECQIVQKQRQGQV